MKRFIVTLAALSILSTACGRKSNLRPFVPRPAPSPTPTQTAPVLVADPPHIGSGSQEHTGHAIAVALQDASASYVLTTYIDHLEYLDGAYQAPVPLRVSPESAHWSKFLMTLPSSRVPPTPIESTYVLGCARGAFQFRTLISARTGALTSGTHSRGRWFEALLGSLSPLFELCGDQDVVVQINLIPRLEIEPIATFLVRFRGVTSAEPERTSSAVGLESEEE